jgi:class 3 adenylate cyclase
VRCPSCERENPAGNAFCGDCGARLALICPSCGRENPADHTFCGACGTRVRGEEGSPAGELSSRDPRSYTPRHLREKILTSRSALEGERKHVTVLFADVRGSTLLAEAVDPEEWHGIMDRCFQLILEQVHRYQGTVNQFLGDGVMALFGAPVALEEAPRCAAIAALWIQAALDGFRQELRSAREIDFRMRIGIHTGLVVVGKIGDDLRMDYTAVGDTTNLAARLQEIARPGSIVVSEATQRALAGFFEMRDLGLLDLRGRAEPIRAFEVVAERAVGGRIDAIAETGLTPLIGRERELESLRTAFESARGGRGQVVFLVGEAGIGKSRLLYEFRRRLGDEPHILIEGRCASYGRATPFLAIVDSLRRRFGIEDRDDELRAFAKVERGVESFGGDLSWTLPFLCQLLSLPVEDPTVLEMDAATRRSETFRALNALFLQASQETSLLFVIEDLHWIDPASAEFLRVMADSIPTHRALLVFTYRPGYDHPFGDRSFHVRITLQALSVQETSAMTGSLLEAAALPEPLRRLIADKAEGNPFFIEEVTKSLVEEGALRIENGRVELGGDISGIAVPDRIQDVLMARIDRLPDEPKRAIQVASVIGREFALRLLERISEVGERMSTVVDELRALELIYEKAAHPELAFMFKHALTHEVAYESILIQRRKALHRVIGTAIEDLYSDRLREHYETLANHFTAAEEWQRALTYHERAAEKAADAYANEVAVEHCRQALAIADRLDDGASDERREHLEQMLGTASYYLSDFRESADAYARAAERSREAESKVINLGRASYSYTWAHEFGRTEETIEQGLALSRAHQLASGEALALLNRGYLRAIRSGDIESYERLAGEALPLAKRSGNAEIIGLVQFSLGELAEWNGDYRRAIELQERVVSIGRRLHVADLVVFGNWFIGKATCCLGDYGRALDQLQQGLALTDRLGNRAWKSRLLNTLGWYFAEIGSHERSRAYNEQAVALAYEVQDDEITGNGEINLALNHLSLGETDRALEYLQPIHEGLEQRDSFMRWRYTLHLLDALAQVALARREPERALEFVDEELRRVRSHRAQKIEARALELRGRVLLALDSRDEAEEAVSASIETANRISYPPVVWRGLGLLAEVAHRRGERKAFEQHEARRRALVERLASSLPDDDLRRALHSVSAEQAP